jgi:hypothetical protein
VSILNRLALSVAVLAAGCLPATIAVTGASAAPTNSAAMDTSGPTNNPFNIWEKFGSSFAVGNDNLIPNTPAIAVNHPGRTLHWFPTSGTYMGNQTGNITFSGGILLASTNDCSNATLKSDPSALGTVWTFKVEDGNLVVINRRCDTAAGSPNTWGLALSGSDGLGDKWRISNMSFRAVLTPAA